MCKRAIRTETQFNVMYCSIMIADMAPLLPFIYPTAYANIVMFVFSTERGTISCHRNVTNN